MTTTKTKQISFEKLIPTLKKFALSDNKKNREAVKNATYKEPLFYAYFDGEYINVTDAITLLRIDGKYISDLPANYPFLYDLSNKQLVSNCNKSYPNVARLIPERSDSYLQLNYDLLKQIRKGLKGIKPLVDDRKNKHFYMSVDNTRIVLSDFRENTQGEAANYVVSHNNHFHGYGDNIKNYALNVKYFDNALRVAEGLKNLADIYPTVNFCGALRPISITMEDVYTILVLPVRSY